MHESAGLEMGMCFVGMGWGWWSSVWGWGGDGKKSWGWGENGADFQYRVTL